MYLSLSQLSVLTCTSPIIINSFINCNSTFYPIPTAPFHIPQSLYSGWTIPVSRLCSLSSLRLSGRTISGSYYLFLPLSPHLSWALGTQLESISQPSLPLSVDMWLCGVQSELRWIEVYNFENMPLKKKAEVWMYQRWKASREETEQEDRGIGLSWLPRAEPPTFK